MDKVAKVFMSGRSQAVRLPLEFRFDESEVFIRRDLETGDLILSQKPVSWDGFFKLLKNTPVPADFLSKKEREQAHDLKPAQDPFEGWEEK